MKQRFHFVSGLPRSGSTLLVNILGQNPRFHVGPTSGVLDIISSIRAQWDNTLEMKATPNDAAKLRVMAAVLPAFYADVERPVIIDKCRGWVAWLEFLVAAYGPVKVLVPVRDIRGILASFEKLYRKNFLRWPGMNEQQYLQCQTVEGRCERWLSYDSPLGIAHNRIRDALRRGFGSMLYFVRFESLTSNPNAELASIHRFLGEDEFFYDFDCVEQLTREDDTVWGMGELHSVHGRVEPRPEDWADVLGAFAKDYAKHNFAHA